MSVGVIDCNVWISALYFGGSIKEAVTLIALDHCIAISPPIYDEILRVLEYPKFARQPEAAGAAKERLADFLRDALWVEPREPVTDCADADDNKYLECALAANANLIVTGDRGLLKLNPWRGIWIVRPADVFGQGTTTSPLR